jgi:GT2 family glycosyltransferase
VNSTSVTVIVPTWNGRLLTARCLEGLARSTFESETIVVDNGSSDGTVAWLSQEFPQVRLIANARNMGFAAAVNQAINISSSPWVALLNNDAVPDPGWLRSLLEVGESAPTIGAVASRMMYRAAPDLVSSAGIRMDPSCCAWDLFVGSATWPQAPVEVFGPSGGACLIRRAMLDDIGLFEAGFFAYLEDVDLAWRARLRGWTTMLAPDALVVHSVSATAGEGSRFKRYYLARNKWLTIARCVPWPLLADYLPVVLAYDALSLANSLRRRDTLPLRGRLAAARNMSTAIRQRQAIQARRTVSCETVRAALSPLESPIRVYRRSNFVERLARAGAGLPTTRRRIQRGIPL